MPVPAAIITMGASAHCVGRYLLQFHNPKVMQGGRAQLTRNFIAYLEVAMQAKHDILLSGYCRTIGFDPRRSDGTQITHRRGTTAAQVLGMGGFYAQRGAIASEATLRSMLGKWTANETLNIGTRYDPAVLSRVQRDRYQYDISYWYDVQDIYVLFHCTPER